MFSMSNMKKKIFIRYLIATIVLVIIGWTALTIYVEKTGPSRQWTLESENGQSTALVVFDPDPFYNLDEQVCLSFGKALAENGINVQIATVAAAEQLKSKKFDVIIYYTNTYNWRPDWAVANYIEDCNNTSQHISSVAITLGAGSTEASQKHLETVITASGGKLIGSYSLWLWRPNDEKKMKEPNVEVAVGMAYDWGKQIAKQIK
jgi:hypothetical protein